jgi:redox-sensitive bicupin YhaK (pirin superfamily)
MRTDVAAEVLVLGGEPIAEPVVGHGPFVMNTEQEIAQAFQDFRAGRMGQLIEAISPDA